MPTRSWTDGRRVLGLTVAIGFAILITLACLHLATMIPGWIVLGWIVVMIAALIGCGVLMFVQGQRQNREAERQRIAFAQQIGFEYASRPKKQEKAKIAKMVGHVPEVRRHRRGLGWYMLGEVRGRSSILVHHTHYRHTGHAIVVVYQMVSAAACNAEWPSLSISKNATPTFDAVPGFRVLRRKLAGIQDVQLESTAFGRVWDVRCESADFAICFLTPEVQEFINRAGASRWDLKLGVLACTLGMTDQLEAAIGLPHRLLDIVEAEPALTGRMSHSKL